MFSKESYFWRTNADGVAIGLSTVCLVHCLVMPLLLVLYPTALVTYFADESVHQFAVLFAVPISVFALTLGCGSHKRFWVMAMGLFGITLLTLPLLSSNESIETPLTIAGASIIAFSHITNMRICRSLNCHDCGDFES